MVHLDDDDDDDIIRFKTYKHLRSNNGKKTCWSTQNQDDSGKNGGNGDRLRRTKFYKKLDLHKYIKS